MPHWSRADNYELEQCDYCLGNSKTLEPLLTEDTNLEGDETPTCSRRTPKSRLQSPTTLQQKVINAKCQEIWELKLKLDLEQYEKNYIMDQLERADEKLKHLTDKYEENLKEVSKLKSERMLKEAEEGQKYLLLQGPDVAKEKKYSAEVRKLKDKIEELEEGTYMLSQQNEGLKKQIGVQSQTNRTLKLTVQEYWSESERLGEELVIKNGQMATLMERCLELEKFMEETKASRSNSSLNKSELSFTGEAEDLGSAVKDLMLCEEKEKNRTLTEKLEVTLRELDTCRAKNSALLEELRTETDDALREVLAVQELSFRKRLAALENRRGTAEATWCSLSLEALQRARACVGVEGGGAALAGMREVVRKVRVFEERPDAHEWAAMEAEKLRERFKVEYYGLRKELKAKEAQLGKATDAFRTLGEKFDAELQRTSQAVREEYEGKLGAIKVNMKEAYNAQSEAQLKSVREQLCASQAFAEELKAKYRQLAREKQLLERKMKDLVSDEACGVSKIHEEAEDFTNTNQADPDRLEQLRFRNSLRPPHLKCTYAAERQFHDPREVKDEDITARYKKPDPPPCRARKPTTRRDPPPPAASGERPDATRTRPAPGLFRKPHKRF